jgi:hypothetical protein
MVVFSSVLYFGQYHLGIDGQPPKYFRTASRYYAAGLKVLCDGNLMAVVRNVALPLAVAFGCLEGTPLYWIFFEEFS